MSSLFGLAERSLVVLVVVGYLDQMASSGRQAQSRSGQEATLALSRSVDVHAGNGESGRAVCDVFPVIEVCEEPSFRTSTMRPCEGIKHELLDQRYSARPSQTPPRLGHVPHWLRPDLTCGFPALRFGRGCAPVMVMRLACTLGLKQRIDCIYQSKRSSFHGD